MKIKDRFHLTFNWALAGIFLLLFLAIGLTHTVLFSVNYLIGVMLCNAVEIGMMALPMTLIIVTGGIDLSVGSMMILSAMAGGLTAAHAGSTIGIICTFLVGGLCGLFNGILIAKVRISPLVTTLATMFLYMGIGSGISGGDSVYAFGAASFLGNTIVAGVPLQILYYIILAVIFTLMLSRMVIGRQLYAVGRNENATVFAGIATDKVKIGIYTLSGIICAFAGIILLGRFTSVKYDAGTNVNLQVITIVVLGGTNILGGYGDMKGTILATLIIAVLNSGLTLLNIPIDTQIIINGIVLVISLITFAVIGRRKKAGLILKTSMEKV